MGFLTLEDTVGSIGATLFPSDLEKYHGLLELDSIVFLRGTVECRNDLSALRVSDVVPLDQARDRLTTQVFINLSSRRHAAAIFDQLDAVLNKYHGEKPVIFRITTRDDLLAAVRCAANRSVDVSGGFCKEVTGLLGPGSVQLCG